jgi:hypothetical protein
VLLWAGKRRGASLKYKVNKAQAFIIGGYTTDNPLDALIVGYREGDKLMFSSKVRKRLRPRLRRSMAEAQRIGDASASVCERAREETHSVLAHPRGNEELHLAQA